jgi:nitroreductase
LGCGASDPRKSFETNLQVNRFKCENPVAATSPLQATRAAEPTCLRNMVFASGACRDRLVAALIDEAQRRPPNVPPLPASFQHFRNELGAQVYGAMGISREDTARHAAAVLRNWELFRAPVAGIVCIHRDLGPDALSVGMFLQTLLLALTERGLGSCVEVSISGYPEIVRAQLAIPTELSILCGLAIGYPDPEFPANKLHIAREPIGENVVFLDN